MLGMCWTNVRGQEVGLVLGSVDQDAVRVGILGSGLKNDVVLDCGRG